jgi:hypothetical protein
MSELIAIKNIKQSSELQPRAKMDTAIIDEYTEAMKRGDAFPAVTVFEIDDAYYLVDGYHRFMAAQGAKIGKILADVMVGGTMRDAILYSAGVNAKHGLNRTNDDKRRAVMILLRDKEWGKWADTQIAAACHVSVDLVSKVRDSSLGETERKEPKIRKIIRKGKEIEMDTTRIGKSSKPLTQPGPDHPNHGKFSAQPGTLPVTDAPPQPSLAQLLEAAKVAPDPEPAPLTTCEEALTPATAEKDQVAGISKKIPACHRGEVCPDMHLEKIRGKICGLLGVPCNQLPRDECPLDRPVPAGFQRATGAPSLASGLPKAQVSTNARRLVIDFTEQQWQVLELLQDDGRAETFIEAVLFLVDEVGRERGLIP